jgi:hypothetical protein
MKWIYIAAILFTGYLHVTSERFQRDTLPYLQASWTAAVAE